MTHTALISKLGFDPQRFGFAARTALGSCIALLLAWLLGLEHPQWSAMTVWAASQSVRGMLLEKSLFRMVGTAIGVVFGVWLVWVSGAEPLAMVIGLALWIGLCVAAGNVLRGFAAYGTLLSGYSASMVVLLNTAHPDQAMVQGVDRFLTVLIGVVVALLVGLLLTPKSAEDPIAGRVRRLLARTLLDMADYLETGKAVVAQEQREILSEMAVIDDALDPHGAGSLRSRRSARTLRAILMAQVSTLLWLRSPDADGDDKIAIGTALRQAAQALRAATAHAEALSALTRAAQLSRRYPALHEVLVDLEGTLRSRLEALNRLPESKPAHKPVILHRDWVGARHAGLRATGVMLLLGAIWVWTGWSGVPFMLLGTSIMISLFSTFDNPASTMPYIFVGQVAGALGALLCYWLVWPLATSALGMVFLTMPFIFLGIFVMAHRRTAPAAFDYNFVLLLLLQPVYPRVASLPGSLLNAVAVVMTPLVALVAYRYVFPTNARRRRDILVTMMVDELQDMAGNPDSATRQPVWRARLYHRLLRIVRWADKAGEPGLGDIDGSLVTLQLGRTVLRLHALRMQGDLTTQTGRRVDATLQRLQQIGQAPERALRALARLVLRMSTELPEDAALVRQAAEGLANNVDYFRNVSRK